MEYFMFLAKTYKYIEDPSAEGGAGGAASKGKGKKSEIWEYANAEDEQFAAVCIACLLLSTCRPCS